MQKYIFGHERSNGHETDIVVITNNFVVNVAYISVVVTQMW